MAFIAIPLAALYAASNVISLKDGLHVGTKATDKLAFYNITPAIVQPSGAGQVALTDSTTGTAATTAAAGTGVITLMFPVQLASMTTAAADLMTAYTPGYKFKILAMDFATTKLGTGAAASQTINLAISGVAVTGGVVNPTLSSTDTLGKLTAGTAVSAANTGASNATLSVKVAASGTVFTAGEGVLLVKIQNMDTADAHASELRLLNALRTALAALGLIKGGA